MTVTENFWVLEAEIARQSKNVDVWNKIDSYPNASLEGHQTTILYEGPGVGRCFVYNWIKLLESTPTYCEKATIMGTLFVTTKLKTTMWTQDSKFSNSLIIHEEKTKEIHN